MTVSGDARRVLVTGHAGFGGRRLLPVLRERGCRVYGIDRVPADGVDLPPDDAFVGDVTDFDFLRRVVGEVRPDIVIHLAAITFGRPSGPEDRRFFEVNVDGTRLLLEAVLAAGIRSRVLVTGSSAAYGAPPRSEQPITELTPLRPQTLYAASKVCQELVALTYHRAHGLPVMVTRAFNHTGPGEHPHFASSAFARQIAEIEAGLGEPPIRVGNLEAHRDFCDVRDVVRAYVAVALSGQPGECYNVCSGVARPMSEVLDHLTALSHRDIPVEVDPDRLQPSDVPYQCGSFAKLQAETGWQPRIPFARTLADLLGDWRRRVSRGGDAVEREGRAGR